MLVDCNNVASSSAFTDTTPRSTHYLRDVEIQNCTNSFIASTLSGTEGRRVYGRNVTRLSTITSLSGASVSNYFFEDDFGSIGLNTQTSNQIGSDSLSTTTESTANNLRTGGGPLNLLVLPPTGTANTGVSTNYFPYSFIKLFEYPIYTDDSSKTYTMYFNSTSTAAWTTDPTASEFWIECEYYNETSGADRILKKSTGVVDFNGTTNWVSLAVTCDPTQAGILYLRGFYGKPKETPMNEFYMDVRPEIS